MGNNEKALAFSLGTRGGLTAAGSCSPGDDVRPAGWGGLWGVGNIAALCFLPNF